MGIDKIIKSLKDSKVEIIVDLLNLGLLPIRIIESAAPTFGIWDIKKKYLVNGWHSNKESFKYQVATILKRAIDTKEMSDLSSFSQEIKRVTKNPFLYDNFYSESDHYQGVSLNDIKYSKYKRDIKSIEGDSDIALILKSIRLNDEIVIDTFSLTEIIIAHQTFHTSKVMAIPCLYSQDRGVGKTTLSLAGGYLYDKSEDSYFKDINMGDGQKAQWGDYEIGTRTVVFDDVPNDSKVVEPLTARIKSSATSAGDITANKKGSGMVRTNSYNQALTTNSIYGIPLDDIRDRRIHPINIHAEDFTDEEAKRIELMNIPMSGARDRHYPIIQKILNHLSYVYMKTINNGTVNKYLNKELPNTKFKIEVAKKKASMHRRFEVIILNTVSINSLISELSDEYVEDKSYFDFLNNPDCAEISKVKNKYYFNLKTPGLVAIGMLFSDDNLSAQKVHFDYFKSKDFKQTKVNGKSVRCVRFEMRRYEDEIPLEIENTDGTVKNMMLNKGNGHIDDMNNY